MADPEGFEPSIPLPVYSLSRGALSTTQPQVLKIVEREKYALLNLTSSIVSVFIPPFFLEQKKGDSSQVTLKM